MVGQLRHLHALLPQQGELRMYVGPGTPARSNVSPEAIVRTQHILREIMADAAGDDEFIAAANMVDAALSAALDRSKALPQTSPVVLITAAEHAIGVTAAAKRRLEQGDRVSFEQFYTSSRFRQSLARARTLADDEHIGLLSARYGLNRISGWHTRATSDDVPLEDLSTNERAAWAWRVVHELRETYGSGPRVFVVFAGAPYVRALKDAAADEGQWTFQEPPRQGAR